ncbi:MAG: hypothetical protein DLM62_15925 [Pseudonocardiales bacterium]|nr:MAG: hypothetical protein DLM62_15925 [Pseudonocardiales bacterium]
MIEDRGRPRQAQRAPIRLPPPACCCQAATVTSRPPASQHHHLVGPCDGHADAERPDRSHSGGTPRQPGSRSISVHTKRSCQAGAPVRIRGKPCHQTLANIDQRQPAYATDWNDLPPWQQETDADIFERIEQDT